MKKKTTYDKNAAGKRLQSRRKQLGWSRSYVAEKIGIVEKYYADIERGICGMSIETLIALANLYGFTMDFLIYGEKENSEVLTEINMLLQKLESLSPQMQSVCLQMLTILVNGISDEAEKQTNDSNHE